MKEQSLYSPRGKDLRRPKPEMQLGKDERIETIRLRKDDVLQYTIYRRMG